MLFRSARATSLFSLPLPLLPPSLPPGPLTSPCFFANRERRLFAFASACHLLGRVTADGGGMLLMLLLCALLRFPTLCMWFMGFTGSSRRGADSWIVVPRLMDRDDDGTDWLSRALRIGSL